MQNLIGVMFMIDSLGTIVDAFNAKVPHLDCITNNIANINTPGFKAEKFYLRLQEQTQQQGVPYTPATRIDFSDGSTQRTGNPLDMAVQGEGFFTVQTNEGEAYTRKGNFTISGDKELMTPEGHFVMGDGGRIVLTGSKIEVSPNGEIHSEEGTIGRLKIVKFAKPEMLTKGGAGLFRNPDNAAILQPQDEPTVQGGSIENSNVQALKEMVAMIDVQRTVESYQKVIQTLNDLDQLSVNRLGKLT
jgi:flagellar basal-body rod protein FlgF